MKSQIRQVFSGESGLFLIMALIHGLAYSFVLPVMSYFIVEGLNSPPYFVGIYTIGAGVASIIFSQSIGKKVDLGMNNKRLLFISVFSFGLATLIFAVTNSFIVVFITGISLMALGNSAISLLLSLGRNFSVSRSINAGLFNSSLRAQISIAWVLGAPLAFWMVANFGFEVTFIATSLICFIWLIAGIRWIPDISGTAVQKQFSLVTLAKPDFIVLLISGSLFFANMANSIYVTSIPLYLILEIGVSEQIPGWLMAMAAAIEIPIMILVAHWATRFNSRHLLYAGIVAGLIFYFGMYLAMDIWHYFILQIANGIFFGIFAGLGITIIQDLLPDRIGYASALYTNTLRSGSMAGAGVMGLVANQFNYHVVLLVAAFCVFIALIFLKLAGISEKRKLKPQSK